MHFVDTNIFIRYFTRDDPDKAKACFELFKRASTNEIILTTTEAVISEVDMYYRRRKRTTLPV
jgi:predicted nucleic acid-binding protein